MRLQFCDAQDPPDPALTEACHSGPRPADTKAASGLGNNQTTKATQSLGMVIHVCIQSSLVAEARRIKRPAWVHSGFQTHLDHVARPCILKQTNSKQTNK